MTSPRAESLTATSDRRAGLGKLHGGSYLEFFRKSVDRVADPTGPSDRADVVLIDSRTGVTEHGGVCTHHFAHLVVLLSAANDLNISGTDGMAERLARPELTMLRNGRPLRMLPISARIEQSAEKEELVKFRHRFAELFQARLSGLESRTFFDKSEIPYVPFYSFVERVVARESPERRHRELYGAYLELSYAIVREGLEMGLLEPPPVAAWLPALTLLQPAYLQAYGSADRSGHGWRELVRSAEKRAPPQLQTVRAKLARLNR
jgi:hypothetical protein